MYSKIGLNLLLHENVKGLVPMVRMVFENYFLSPRNVVTEVVELLVDLIN